MVRAGCSQRHEWKLTARRLQRITASAAFVRTLISQRKIGRAVDRDNWKRPRWTEAEGLLIPRMSSACMARNNKKYRKIKTTKTRAWRPRMGHPPARFSGVRDPPPRTACRFPQVSRRICNPLQNLPVHARQLACICPALCLLGVLQSPANRRGRGGAGVPIGARRMPASWTLGAEGPHTEHPGFRGVRGQMGVGCWLCLFGTWRDDLRVDGDMGTYGSMGELAGPAIRLTIVWRFELPLQVTLISTGPPPCDHVSNHILTLARPVECFPERARLTKERERKLEPRPPWTYNSRHRDFPSILPIAVINTCRPSVLAAWLRTISKLG